MNKQTGLALASGILPLAIYLLTLAPTVTWRNNGADSGDLVTAAFTLGIPHPTGYPLYTILAAIFAHLPLGEPAKNVGAFSALAASGAIIFLARAGCALLGDATPLARWVPPSFALMLAFAPAVWSQATIAEVNALAAFFAAALLAVLLSSSLHRLYYAAAIFGLGLTHHLSLVLVLPSAIILLGSARYTRSQYLYAAILVLVPLALYLYLPIRAATHPPINWGNPETWDGFSWVVSGAPYRPYLFAAPIADIFARVGLVARFIFEQFTFVGVALGLWGAMQMAADARRRRVFIALMLAFGMVAAYAIGYTSRDSFVYLTPVFMVFALWMMGGVADVATRLFPPLPQTEDDSPRSEAERRRWGGGGRVRALLLALLVLLPVYNLGTNFGRMNLSFDFTAFDYAKNILTDIPADAVIIADGDEHYFALTYYRHVVTPEKNQIIVSAELLQYSWYYDNIRRAMPSLDEPSANPLDRLAQVMDASLAKQRGVYTALQNEWFAPYALERRDNYYRVLGRAP